MAHFITHVTGVSMAAYWISTYMWDSFLFLLLDAFVLFVFYLFQNNAAKVFAGGQQFTPCYHLYLHVFRVCRIDTIHRSNIPFALSVWAIRSSLVLPVFLCL
jgi:hypothetical protein